MNYQTERGVFLEVMRAEGVPQVVTRAVLRDAATIQRLAVAQCNGDYPCDNGTRAVVFTCKCEGGYVPEAIKGGQCPDCRAQARIVKALAPYKIEADFQGDPRGACVKLVVPSGRTDDWGRTGMCVPTRA